MLEEHHAPALVKLVLPLNKLLQKTGVVDGSEESTFIPSKHDQLILSLVTSSPDGVTSSAASRILGISDRITQRRLKALYDDGQIERVRKVHAFAYIPKK